MEMVRVGHEPWQSIFRVHWKEGVSCITISHMKQLRVRRIKVTQLPTKR